VVDPLSSQLGCAFGALLTLLACVFVAGLHARSGLKRLPAGDRRK